MEHLAGIKEEESGKLCRTYWFKESGELQTFLQSYQMNIENCLKAMAMDPECTNMCFDKNIHEFGGRGCNARCDMN